MTNAQQLRRHVRAQWVAFSILLIASIGLMGLSGTGVGRGVRDAFSYTLQPVTSGMNDAANSVGSIWSALLEIDHLRADNEQLREENQQLKNELARMPAVERLYDDWTALTQTQKEIQYATQPARVIGREISDVGLRTFLLDKGSNNGIREDDVVIAAGGALVGRVIDVQPVMSTVLLVIDPTNVVIGKAPGQASGQSKDATGAVTGQVGDLLQMSDVEADVTLLQGADVTTAGYSAGTIRSLYPAGLLIGQIVDVTRNANGSNQTALVTPAVDFRSLDFVLVITNYEGGILAEPTPSPSGSAAGSGKASGSASPRASATARPSARP